jgi:hypothetical protein
MPFLDGKLGSWYSLQKRKKKVKVKAKIISILKKYF